MTGTNQTEFLKGSFDEDDIRFMGHQLHLRRVALQEAVRRDEADPDKANMVKVWKEWLHKLETIILKFDIKIDSLDGMDDIHWLHPRRP